MADKFLKVDIVTPQSVVFSGEAVSVNLPGSMSPFEVLINHAPIVSSLDNGIIKIISSDNREIYFAANSGFAEVKQNVVSVLVEQAFESSSIKTDSVLAHLEQIKSDISNAESPSEKLHLASKMKFEQIKLKAVTLSGRN